jgi:hypothetical protein
MESQRSAFDHWLSFGINYGKINPALRINPISTLMRILTLSLILLGAGTAFAGTPYNKSAKVHDRTQALPPVVTPGQPSTQIKAGTAPSDAIVLFDGSDTSSWVSWNGEPAEWAIEEGVLVCTPRTGSIRTLRNFGDCQFHIEWTVPVTPDAEGQGRNNSGVFFGLDRYEVQILDSYENVTYSDGSAGAVYGQYAPLANAMLPPETWQTYDILYSAPKFDAAGVLKSPAMLTVLHNGVLVQHNAVLDGPTAWINRPPYQAHPEKLPISLQDHGNPVRYRNIWVRELGPKTPAEYTYAKSYLESLSGTYKNSWGSVLKIELGEHDQLTMNLAGETLPLYAQSETLFFAKTTDILVDFSLAESENKVKVSVGAGWDDFEAIE